ncbi:MAG: hypothetical protein GX900_02970 [Clostridiaceae bacterium]|nr:hypothetical protein [Clostridiaceae bacterium]
MFKKKRDPAFGDRLLRILLIIGLLVSVLTFVLWYTNRNSALLTVEGSVEGGENLTTADTPVGKTGTTTNTSVHTETERTTSTSGPRELVKVYVTGAVIQPGVYTLKAGSCLIDALEAAGGAATDASIQYINLAQLLISHTMIYIPSEADVATLKENHEISEMLRIIDKWVQPLELSAHEYTYAINTAGNRQEKAKVDINHADMKALMTLPGIGEVTAAKIIEFRESRGGFRDLNELMLVPGIKEGKFAALVSGITISPR